MLTDADRLQAMRMVLARHRRRRQPDRTRCAWCHRIYPCPQRQQAADVLQAANEGPAASAAGMST